MKVQEVCRAVIRTSGQTQKEIAERHGKSGQSSISMMFQSKSMRVDSLLMILNDCGYDLVARSRDKELPNYIIGDEINENYAVEDSRHDKLRELVRELVNEELDKRDADDISIGRGSSWNKYLKEEAKRNDDLEPDI